MSFCISIQVYGEGVDAIAQTGGGRTVVKDVAKVRVAFGTGDFDASHSKTQVFDLVDALGIYDIKETGPSAMGIELLIRAEEFGIATYAAIEAFIVAIPIHTRKSAFSAFLASDVILFGHELCAPFFFGFGNLLFRHVCSFVACVFESYSIHKFNILKL